MSSDRHPRGLMLVISSPSGVGKTSLARRLMADHADLEFSVSMTTRAPRPGEQEGREYHFVSRDEFMAKAAEGYLLEWAEVHGYCYGTPKAPVMETLAAGRNVIFDVDWQGAHSIYAAAPADTARVFILPPSIREMSRRIHARAGETDEMIRQRLETAKVEFTKWGEYDYILLNDDFDRAYSDLAHIYHAERLRRERNPWIGGFVEGLEREQVGG
jgi:guanylate kinase